MLATWIAIGVIVLIVAGAAVKIMRDKRRGIKCIGCPYAQRCGESGMADGGCSHIPDISD